MGYNPHSDYLAKNIEGFDRLWRIHNGAKAPMKAYE